MKSHFSLLSQPNLTESYGITLNRQILSSDGEELSRITSYNGFAANRLGSISCLAFHPNELILAAGDSASILSLFAPDD